MVVLINGFILIIDYHRLESAANAATFMLPTLLNPPSCEGGLVFCWSVLLSRKTLTRSLKRGLYTILSIYVVVAGVSALNSSV